MDKIGGTSMDWDSKKFDTELTKISRYFRKCARIEKKKWGKDTAKAKEMVEKITMIDGYNFCNQGDICLYIGDIILKGVSKDTVLDWKKEGKQPGDDEHKKKVNKFLRTIACSVEKKEGERKVAEKK